ncbi:hypothetical protein [Ornithinimicrobium kibberense]|uniref:hypothetical protein n=1 Tax=Ornithinimicrobium kibberense TaxID=282060 RepID=UPI0036121B1C
MSTFTCVECGRMFRGQARRTATGRRVCTKCEQGVLGAAAGVLMAQRQGADPVAGAISTRGWLQRIRLLRGKDQ